VQGGLHEWGAPLTPLTTPGEPTAACDSTEIAAGVGVGAVGTAGVGADAVWRCRTALPNDVPALGKNDLVSNFPIALAWIVTGRRRDSSSKSSIAGTCSGAKASP
jgi:hypothetical protein